jgi:hypothetical protein
MSFAGGTVSYQDSSKYGTTVAGLQGFAMWNTHNLQLVGEPSVKQFIASATMIRSAFISKLITKLGSWNLPYCPIRLALTRINTIGSTEFDRERCAYRAANEGGIP